MAHPDTPSDPPPEFDGAFVDRLAELMRWRRDVRRFRTDPVDEAVLRLCLAMAALAPSVGNAQPWRFVRVSDPERRGAVVRSFEHCNAKARAGYDDARGALYAGLKLAGLREAPIHLAVFCDEGTADGHGLGRATMPEMLRYSVVTAVHAFWLAARAHELGVGWVSIVEPDAVTAALDVPNAWQLVAYLCVGHPLEVHVRPELARFGWQDRSFEAMQLLER